MGSDSLPTSAHLEEQTACGRKHELAICLKHELAAGVPNGQSPSVFNTSLTFRQHPYPSWRAVLRDLTRLVDHPEAKAPLNGGVFRCSATVRDQSQRGLCKLAGHVRIRRIAPTFRAGSRVRKGDTPPVLRVLGHLKAGYNVTWPLRSYTPRQALQRSGLCLPRTVLFWG